jgi:hypothetical protein
MFRVRRELIQVIAIELVGVEMIWLRCGGKDEAVKMRQRA